MPQKPAATKQKPSVGVAKGGVGKQGASGRAGLKVTSALAAQFTRKARKAAGGSGGGAAQLKKKAPAPALAASAALAAAASKKKRKSKVRALCARCVTALATVCHSAAWRMEHTMAAWEWGHTLVWSQLGVVTRSWFPTAGHPESLYGSAVR